MHVENICVKKKVSYFQCLLAFFTDAAKDVGSNIGVQNNRKHELLAVFLILVGASVALSLK